MQSSAHEHNHIEEQNNSLHNDSIEMKCCTKFQLRDDLLKDALYVKRRLKQNHFFKTIIATALNVLHLRATLWIIASFETY